MDLKIIFLLIFIGICAAHHTSPRRGYWRRDSDSSDSSSSESDSVENWRGKDGSRSRLALQGYGLRRRVQDIGRLSYRRPERLRVSRSTRGYIRRLRRYRRPQRRPRVLSILYRGLRRRLRSRRLRSHRLRSSRFGRYRRPRRDVRGHSHQIGGHRRNRCGRRNRKLNRLQLRRRRIGGKRHRHPRTALDTAFLDYPEYDEPYGSSYPQREYEGGVFGVLRNVLSQSLRPVFSVYSRIPLVSQPLLQPVYNRRDDEDDSEEDDDDDNEGSNEDDSDEDEKSSDGSDEGSEDDGSNESGGDDSGDSESKESGGKVTPRQTSRATVSGDTQQSGAAKGDEPKTL